MSNTYTYEDVKIHHREDDVWVVIDNTVYDLTKFIQEHPGGMEVIMDRAGMDATDCFEAVGHSVTALEKRKEYKIGEIVQSQRREKVIREEYIEPKQKEKGKIETLFLPLVIVLLIYYLAYKLY